MTLNSLYLHMGGKPLTLLLVSILIHGWPSRNMSVIELQQVLINTGDDFFFLYYITIYQMMWQPPVVLSRLISGVIRCSLKTLSNVTAQHLPFCQCFIVAQNIKHFVSGVL